MKRKKNNSIIKLKKTINVAKNFILNIVFSPIKAGLSGFALFFTVNILLHMYEYIIGNVNYIYVDEKFIEESLPGFLIFLILAYAFKILPFVKDKLKNYSAFQFFSSFCQL